MKQGGVISAIVRPAGSPDVRALSVLAKATYATTFGHSMTPAELDWQLEHTRAESCFSRSMETDAILLALVGDRVVGYVQVTDVTLPVRLVEASDQQLNALYVDGEFQGRGVGRQLMDAALELPRMRSARNLYLDVWNENFRALRFYTRDGFHEAGACDVVVDSRVIGKDLIMRLCLPAVLPRRRFSAEPSQGQK